MGIEEIFYKVFGTPSERRLKRLHPYVDRINELEPEIEKLSAEDFPRRTAELREKIAKGISVLDEGLEKEERQKQVNTVLWDHLPEVFAMVREASRRTIGLRHYDVQLLGGMIRHDGGIAEMRTGEGKTLVATASVTRAASCSRMWTVLVSQACRSSSMTQKLPRILPSGSRIGTPQ